MQRRAARKGKSARIVVRNAEIRKQKRFARAVRAQKLCGFCVVCNKRNARKRRLERVFEGFPLVFVLDFRNRYAQCPDGVHNSRFISELQKQNNGESNNV